MPPRKVDAADISRHAEMLGNRVGKAFRRLHPLFERRSVGAFRLYDWDIPEVRAVVDWYEGHLVVAEYEREQTAGTPWLDAMGRAAGDVLSVPAERVHLKRRHTRPSARPALRYARDERARAERLVVREGELRFLVELEGAIDTGLYPDHRITRSLVGAESEGREVLNLFGYTGSFTCAAALGGAMTTTTVDASARFLSWCRDNLQLNGLLGPRHHFERAEVREFLRGAAGAFGRFDLAILDPPSFSTRGPGGAAGGGLDLQRDHPALIRETLAVLREGGVLWFSTNHQRFEPRLEGLPAREVVDMTERTVPEDYRNRQVHRCWRMVR